MQDLVLRGLIDGYEEVKKQGGKHGVLTGTSNVSCCLHSLLEKGCKLNLVGVPGPQIWSETYRYDRT